VLRLAEFGARGDGRSDDTTAIQAALNAAQPGTTVMGQSDARYVISNTLTFPADQVTLDLDGASIRVGAHRVPGSELQTNDTMFSISGRNGVRITNGKILSAGSGSVGSGIRLLGGLPFLGGGTQGGAPYRIHIVGGQNCTVDRMTAVCAGSLFVYLSGKGHTISGNRIMGGGIAGVATTNVTVQGNTLTYSPSDAISFTGYPGAPVTGTRYLNNTISGYGRVGIEEYSPGNAQYCISPTLSGNRISSPSDWNSAGTGISAISSGATINDNRITDAVGWAIEATGLGTTIAGNRIGWSSQSGAARRSTAIVINTSLPSDTRPVSVRANSINGGSTGIELYGSAFYCPVTIDKNQIRNALQKGIVLAPAATSGLVRVSNNVVSFGKSSSGDDAIVTAAGAVVTGNKVP
jgi:hypothetical protein